MIIISLICLLSLILFVAFEQNTIFEYGNFLQIKLPYKNEYQNILDSGGSIQYVSFLRGIYKDNFFIQGLTCPVCLSVWLSFLLSIISFNLLYVPIINLGGLLGFFVLRILSRKI